MPEAEGLARSLVALQELAERLRRECPWDREQTARSIVPHTVEEAYEVADAALAGDDEKLLDELGDLLFQVYFLALLLEEREAGDLVQVAEAVQDKLVRRHPHVFGDAVARTAGAVKRRWERLKAEQEEREGVFHHVPATLPALLHARKVQRRAAAIGFDYPDAAEALEDLESELSELEGELAGAGDPAPEREPDPAQVLDGDRVVEPVLLADLVEPRLVGVGAGEHARGVAGDQAHAREHDEADHGERDDGQEPPLEQVVEHARLRRGAAAPRYCQDVPLMRTRPSGVAL